MPFYYKVLIFFLEILSFEYPDKAKVSLDLVRAFFSPIKQRKCLFIFFLLTSLPLLWVRLCFYVWKKLLIKNMMSSCKEKLNNCPSELYLKQGRRCPPTPFKTNTHANKDVQSRCRQPGGVTTQYEFTSDKHIIQKIIQRIHDNEWICNECLCLYFFVRKIFVNVIWMLVIFFNII